MKKKQRTRITHRDKGITLIALVVTIVVLIILATISINLVVNSNIIGRAEKSSGIQDKATELERLELIKGSTAIEYKGKVTVDNYMKVAIKDGVVEGVNTPEELEAKNEDGSQDFITDNGWSVNVAPDTENPNNVIITIEGKDKELKPIITKIDTSATKTSITAKAKVRHLSGGTIECYYKLSSAEDSAYTKIENVTDNGVTIEGLTEGTEYDIKVVVTNKNGEDTKETSIMTTKTPVEQITLNKTTETVTVGETVTLIATILPTDATNKNITWTSSDSSIAEVNSTGIVTGRKSGTATITAAATDGSGVTATCIITVRQLVEQITLNKTTETIRIEGTVTLTATVLPTGATNKDVTWTSSDSSIVEVNGTGIATGRKSGTATITATATDGSGVTATCIITVRQLVTTITTTNHGNILAIDSQGKTLTVPGGFKYVTGTTINQGIVIQDGSDNQFVWIPMASNSDFPANQNEPYDGGYPDEKTDYDTMKRQVLKHGGFYIGRYEAGVNTTQMRTTETAAQTVVCKAGVAPYNYVRWGESMSQIGTRGAVYLAKKMYQNSSYITSTLCYDCQWDAMCTFIGDGDRRTPTKSATGLTGSVPSDVSKNIYDLAGNCQEWTMQAVTEGSRAGRGGNYKYAWRVANRDGFDPANGGDNRLSFRVSFYIKN